MTPSPAPWPIFEYRVHDVEPGRLAQAVDRMCAAAPLAAWTPLAGPEHRLACLLHWPDIDHRQPDQDEGGESWLLGPHRAWKRWAPGQPAPGCALHEMRIHRTFSGQADPVANYLGEIEHPQLQALGGTILGVFDVLIGPEMPAIITFLGWPDFATQQHAAARLDMDPRVAQRRRQWKADPGEPLIRSVQQTLLRPIQP